MKTKNLSLLRRSAYLLAPGLFAGTLMCGFLASCTPNTGEKATTEKKDSIAKTNTADTSLHGLVGVIEKNPPVQSGDYVAKYPNGIIKMRGYYINGKRNGQWSS